MHFRMRKIWRVAIIGIVILFLCIAAYSCIQLMIRHHYDPKDRVSPTYVYLSDILRFEGEWYVEPTKAELHKADLVFEGVILDEGQIEVKERLFSGRQYAVKVDSVWKGTVPSDIIQVQFSDKIPQPLKNDHMVLMCSETDASGIYRGNGEHGMFVKNPPFDLLYAFSVHKDSLFFDGKPVSALKRAMREIEQHIENGGKIEIKPMDWRDWKP